MLRAVIDFSLRNKGIVLLVTLALTIAGIFALRNIPLDAIPDLSDTQVIIYTEWPGQAPQIVQDQVTYPITTKMLSIPRAKVVRGYSFYGFSFVYVIFEDGTDPYWARSRVLEYLSGLSGRLPQGVTPSLGPDATGVGWAFMYSLNSKERSLAELRSMQDWYLKYQLTSVEGVAEVASVGGFVKQYQVTVDPTKLRAYNLSIADVSMAIKKSNGEVGGRSIEMAEKEFILRVRGYVNSVEDLKKVAVGAGAGGVPILLRDVANVQLGPDMRRGIAELNGEGETVGGIVVVRYGANARQVIQQVNSLLVITVSFIPVFALQAQEGRLFKPLAYTKTYSMAAAALLSLTLAPILMGYFIRGKLPPEEKNPINRFLIKLYHPVIDFVIHWRWWVITASAVVVLWVFFPWNWLVTNRLPEGKLRALAGYIGKLFPYQSLGSEFMPPLYEGDLLYMPTTFPGISTTKAREILQQTDQIIKSFPEVHHVFGKIGRAETATDPAPMDMVETTIMLKDEKDWPAVDIKDQNGKTIAHRKRTVDELTEAMNAAIQFPGLNNAWTMPIKTRIDMLATGIKTPVGIKVAGPNLAELERIASQIETVVRQVPGTSSVFAERVMGGNYIEFTINRDEIARYGLALGDVQEVLEVALGGMPLTTTVEGLERYSVNLRYDRDFRENLEALKQIIVPTPSGAQVPLGQLAKLNVVRAPMGVKSEGATPNAWIYVDVKGIDVGAYVQMAQRAVNQAIANKTIQVPSGYNIFWSGQYEYMLRAQQRLMIVVPITLLIIVLIIYLNTRSLVGTAIVMLSVPLALVGSFWLLYLDGYNLSVAVWIGLIALAGVSAETGVVMLLYLDLAYDQWQREGKMRNAADLRDAIYHGAVKRVRPKAMTAAVIIGGLVPILWSHGAGADVMKRIATPMIGGIVTSTIMELVVFPAVFFLWRSRRLKDSAPDQLNAAASPAFQKV